MISRIPFDFTLIDTRHRPFVEGSREMLLSLFQVITRENSVRLAGNVLIGLLFLFLAGQILIHDFSVEWVSTEATITSIAPVQSVNKFNWWYFYTFETENGTRAQGKIVMEDRHAFVEGQRVPVRYVRSDPLDNRYANDPLPRSVLGWFFLAMSIVLLGSSALRIRRDIADYRVLRDIARAGEAVPGVIVAVHNLPWHSHKLQVEIEYTFTTTRGTRLQKRDSISLVHLPGKVVPKPGAIVAVWYVGEHVALLL